MSGFMSAMKSTLNDEFNVSVTENGAIGYRTTGKELLDLNFAVASLRKASPIDIANRFIRAFFEDKITAMKWLFFVRDVRGGLGERRLFRIVFQRMAEENPEYIIPLLPLVPEYGRYDDLWCLFDTKLAPNVLNIIAQQLREDIQNLSDGNGISLLAKWLPSANAHSADAKRYANRYFMLKFFQIATPDDDPDNWRSKKEEAEQEAEMAIVRPIITKIDDHVKAYLNANENEAGARKALIEVVKKYVKDGNKPTADYMNYLTDPTVAGELLEELQKQFPVGTKKKSVAKKEGNA